MNTGDSDSVEHFLFERCRALCSARQAGHAQGVRTIKVNYVYALR